MHVDFRSCINNWCYQNGTMGQYTRCKRVSNNGRTCHNPEIRYGTTIGGKPGGYMGYGTEWCKQLFPTTSITHGTVIYKVTYHLIVILKKVDATLLNPHQLRCTYVLRSPI